MTKLVLMCFSTSYVKFVIPNIVFIKGNMFLHFFLPKDKHCCDEPDVISQDGTFITPINPSVK